MIEKRGVRSDFRGTLAIASVFLHTLHNTCQWPPNAPNKRDSTGFLLDGNVTVAAERAGYLPKCACVAGQETLRRFQSSHLSIRDLCNLLRHHTGIRPPM